MSEQLERTPVAQADHEAKTAPANPFEDDTPIVASCNLENPEACEACD